MSGGLLLDTDLLAGYLVASAGKPSLLRRLLALAPCLTTVLQAAELLAAARSPEERAAVERLLVGLKVMGLNGRYATTMARVSTSIVDPMPVAGVALAALAIDSGLAIVTDRLFAGLCNIPGVRVLCASDLQQEDEAGLCSALAVAGATRR